MFAPSGDESGEIRDVVPKLWTQAAAKKLGAQKEFFC